uniref:Uncharacterized protein n=1 Tax=Opuntia streptacantha TaxID=393608 RepID=A0A7C9EVD2_OPUST
MHQVCPGTMGALANPPVPATASGFVASGSVTGAAGLVVGVVGTVVIGLELGLVGVSEVGFEAGTVIIVGVGVYGGRFAGFVMGVVEGKVVPGWFNESSNFLPGFSPLPPFDEELGEICSFSLFNASGLG